MSEREVWVIEDATGQVAGAYAYANRTEAERGIADGWGERIVRYVPEPEWWTANPDSNGRYLCECQLHAGDPWVVDTLVWMDGAWSASGLRVHAVRRYTDIPQPPPLEDE